MMASLFNPHPTRSRTLSLKNPPFLAIPFELRLQIYEIVLDKRLAHDLHFYLCISTVCRQIRAEVLPVVFQDARYLRSLSHISKWTSKGNPYLLNQVQSISLHVFMESLSSITVSRPTYPIVENDAKPFTADWWEAKYAEQFQPPEPSPIQPFSFRKAVKSKISKAIRFPSKSKVVESPIAMTWNALTAIGQLKKIWILLNDQTSAPHAKFDIEQQLVLNMIAAACPKMQEFTGFSNLLPLEYLRNFKDLRLLRFSGYSKSSPEETLGILQSFKYLHSIIVYRYPEYYDRDHAIVTKRLPEYLSFTPEVLEKVKSLKRFEISHMTPRVPSEHVTVPILKALRAHKHSLRALSIRSDSPVSGEYMEELVSFIACSDLSNLWIQLIIPKKLESLMGSEVVFPRNTRTRERKISESHLSSASWELVSFFVKAS